MGRKGGKIIMKAIMISVRPKWVAKILNGEKTIEIRKTMPKCDLPIDVYIYCTKEKILGNLIMCKSKEHIELFGENAVIGINKGFIEKEDINLQGKVVAKFTLNKIVPIVMQKGATHGYGNKGYIGYGYCDKGNFKFMFDMEKETCLEHNEELCKYLNNGKNLSNIIYHELEAKVGCAWHIDNLEIFDTPKELSEFKKPCYVFAQKISGEYGGVCMGEKLTKAPQSWQFIEVEDDVN